MKIFNIQNDKWLKEAIDFCKGNNLVCLGDNDRVQWFGTNLSKALALKGISEVSDIYGKLVNTMDEFCYQLCHSTPWGFEMGRNGNAVVDVLRGEPSDKEKLFPSEKCTAELRFKFRDHEEFEIELEEHQILELNEGSRKIGNSR